VAFAAAYLMLAGLMNLIWGVTALSKKSYFLEDGLVWSGLQTWGLISVIVAAIQIATGVLLFARKGVGALLAIFVAMSAILINFVSIGAYPVWSAVAIAANGLVLWAVTVHGEDFG
jgi:hypothetical protein